MARSTSCHFQTRTRACWSLTSASNSLALREARRWGGTSSAGRERRRSSLNCEEIFGPVVTLEPYDDFAHALRLVNESAYGLQAGVFTRDAARIFQAFEELEVGGVIAGDVPSFRIDHMPYGGVKDSGLGREGLRYAIEDMTEPRLLVMNLR